MSAENNARSRVQRIAYWFGMEGLPRASIAFRDSNYALIVARHDDRIRLVIGTTHPSGDGVGGTHVGMTERQATKLRDELTRLLAIQRGS